MMSHPGQQITTIPILPNNPRSKGNQTKRFSQLIEHNMRNIFLEESYINCGGETSLRTFSKKSKFNIT